ncbi:3'-5' exonuclease [Nitratifractor sp.]
MLTSLKRAWQKSRLKDPKYSFLFEPYEGDEVVVLDTETTGMDPKKDEILSIGAVIVRGNHILLSDAFEAWLRPSGEISAESIKIHGIRRVDIEHGEAPEEVIPRLLEFIGNRPVVGYYIRFDQRMLSAYTRRLLGIDLPNELIELSEMYYRRYRKSSPHEFVDLKFDTIMETLDLPRLGKHDALNDAIMSALIYLKLRSMPEYKGAFA